jgi:hypothetical protein
MLEGFRKKIVAKTHELFETQKAEESMASQQSAMSYNRENYMNSLRATGVDVADDLYLEEEEIGNNETRILLRGTFDGKYIEMEGDSLGNERCVVEGVEVTSKEEIKELWEKYALPAQIAKEIHNPETLAKQ